MLPATSIGFRHRSSPRCAAWLFFLNLLFCLMPFSSANVLATTVFAADASDGAPTPPPETTPDVVPLFLRSGRQLAENFTGRWRTSYLHYFQEPTCAGSNNRVKADGTDDAETLLEWSTWMKEESWRLGISGRFEAGTQDGLWGGTSDFIRDTDNRRPYLSFNEFYLRYYADDFDVVAGKQAIKHGFGQMYSPADRFGPRDYTDPFEERNLGVWQLGLDYYFPSFSVSAAVLPVFQPSRLPGLGSRWVVNPTGMDLACAPWLRLEGTRNVPGVDFDDIGLMALAKTNLSGWDLYALGYYGVNPYPTARLVELNIDPFAGTVFRPVVTARFATDYLKVLDLGAGFATTWGRLALYGEGLYQAAVEGEDDDCLDYLFGISLRLGGGWTKGIAEETNVNLEYTGSWVARSRTNNDVGVPSRSFITGGENLLLGRMDFQLNARANLILSAGATGSWRDLLYRIEGRFRVRPQWLLRLTLETFQVDTAGYFGPWRDNDRLIAAVEYRF